MRKKNSLFSKFYIAICFAFFYLPILVTMVFSFNSSKSLSKFTGFSLRWYKALLENSEIMSAVYVSVTIGHHCFDSVGNNDSHRPFKVTEDYQRYGAQHE